MKSTDIGNDFIFQVLDHDGSVVDLTSATSAFLITRLNGATTSVTKTMTFHDRSNGKVKYKADSGFLSAPGTIIMEVKVKFDASNIFYSDTIKQEIKGHV